MKKMFTFAIVLALVLAMPSYVSGAGQMTAPENAPILEVVSIRGTQISIYPEAKNIPISILQDLAAENPQGNVIVYEYSGPAATEEFYDDTSEITHRGVIFGPIKTTISNVQQGRILADNFVFSAARGQSTTITAKITKSLSASFTGEVISFAEIGVAATVSTEYSIGTTFTGPDAPYNSREFRVKFLGETGNFGQTRTKTYVTVGGIKTGRETETKSGTYAKPMYFTAYSIDTLE